MKLPNSASGGSFSERFRFRSLFSVALISLCLVVFALSQIEKTANETSGDNGAFVPESCSTPGSLDPTFGGDGKVVTRFGDSSTLNSIALQSDGKIVAVGSVNTGSGSRFLVVRYNADGSLDAAFDGDGFVITSFGGGSSAANGVAIQADGKIVVVGSSSFSSNADFAIARYNPDGSLDSAFDDDGKVTTAVPGPHGDGTDVANAVAIQSDGKFIVAGYIPDGSGTGSYFGVVRYNPGGSVDLTFGNGGRTATSIGFDVNHAQAVAIQSGGKIVVAGQSGPYLGIARFNEDGSADNSFAGNGRLLTSFGFSTSSYSIALQVDDKIVAAVRHNRDFAVARYNIDGSSDTSFGTNGVADTPIYGGQGAAVAVATQSDGKIVAAGRSFAGFNGFATARYNSDGTLDNTFDDDGVATTLLGNGSSYVRSLAIQSDAKIVTAGISAGSGSGFGLARYNGAPCGPPTATPTETPTHTPTLTPTQSPTATGTLTNTPTATPTAIPHSSCSFNNGGLNPQAVTESGIPAPAGFFWSEVQHDAGNTAEANNAGGWNGRQGSFRLADNFTIGQPCTISSVDLYGFQIDAPQSPSPFTACTLRIWKGRPGDLGSRVVFGDATTNRLAASVDSTYYRIFNTVAPPPGTKPVESNKIWKNTITIGATLPAGTYWIDWASTVSNGGNHYYASKTIAGSRGALTDDGRLFSGSPPGQWFNIVDPGLPFSAPDYAQDFPFGVTGEIASPTPTSTLTATPTSTATPATPVTECDLAEDFDDVTMLSGNGWPEINNSSPTSATSWFQGNNAVFASQKGAANSYIAVNYQSGSESSTLSNWLLTPPVLLQNGAQLTFWTRTVDFPGFPDRLQVRMSTNGNSTDVGILSTDVGDFTTLLLDINPTYTVAGYPSIWTQYTVTISGVSSPVKGRLAFRYFVENGGPSGENSDYIGIDSVRYSCAPESPTDTPTETPTSVPTETPADTPTETPTSVPTETPADTPTPTPTIPPVISGAVTYINAASPPRYVSNVTISGSGSILVSTTTSFPDGTYSLSGFGDGPYTLTPSKPGSPPKSITSFDAAMVARHVTGAQPLTGNQLLVADVSGNGDISSFDASEIARFVAVLPPYGSAGSWKFIPESRNYSSVTSSVAGEDYGALLMGEVSGNWTDKDRRPDALSRQLPVGSGPEKSVAVEIPHSTIVPGAEITVPVNVIGAAGNGFISYEFDLRFDPGVIKPLDPPVGLTGTASLGLAAIANEIEPGLLRVVVYGAFPIESDGVLVNLRFSAIGAAGSVSPLSFERIMFNEGEPRVAASDGQVKLF